MKYCGKCGTKNIDADLYCVGCGKPLDRETKKEPKESPTVPEKESNVIYRDIGRIFCVVAVVFNLAVLYFWKFDIKVSEVYTEIVIGNEQLSLFELASINFGSAMGLIVVLMVVVSILCFITPEIGALNSVIIFLGGLWAGLSGVVSHGSVVDLLYSFAFDVDSGTLGAFGIIIVPCVLFFVGAFVLAIPKALYAGDRFCKNSEDLMMLWKEPNWFYKK